MNILLANDDGVKEPGLVELGKHLAKRKDTKVYVCGPATQQSGKSHSIAFLYSITIEDVEAPEGVCRCLSCAGTPADCVRLGLMILQESGVEIDLVISGINAGVNLGTDIWYSGTVGAAMEGCFCEKPAIAVSIGSDRTLDCQVNVEYTCKLLCRIIDEHFEELNPGWLLNLNVPAIPEETIRGIRITRLGKREYNDLSEPLEQARTPEGYEYNWHLTPCTETDMDMDIAAVQNGFVSITPIRIDCTDYEKREVLKGWKL